MVNEWLTTDLSQSLTALADRPVSRETFACHAFFDRDLSLG
jgi:hypothetical protein